MSQTNFDKPVQFVFNPPSTNTTDQTTGEESSRQVGNNSGGDNEGSTSHSQHHNVFQGESSRSVHPRRLV